MTGICRVGRAVAVARHREPGKPGGWQAERVEIVAFCDLGHRPCGLAGGQNDQPAAGWRLRQMRHKTGGRMHGGHRCRKQVVEEGSPGVHAPLHQF